MKFSIDKDIKDITKEDLENLVAKRTLEDAFLDFKISNYGHTNADKRELLKDVSAFANANGGELIIGVEEDEYNQAKNLVGIESSNIANDLTRLEQIIQSGLEPKLDTFKIRYVKLADNKYAIIIRIEKSPLYPHMVSFQRTNKFYVRKSDKNLLLDGYELRNVFLTSENVVENIRAYNQRRLSSIYADITIVPLIKAPKVLLNFIPYDALTKRPSLDFNKTKVDLGFTEQRINFDGFFGYKMDNRGINSYCQLYRSGILEYISTSKNMFGEVINPFGGKDKVKVIWGGKAGYEYHLIRRGLRFLKILENLQVQTPLYLFLSIMSIKGYRILYKDEYGKPKLTSAIDRDFFALPELEIKDFNTDFKRIVKDLFNMVWNACGEHGSVNYKGDEWKGVEVNGNK